MRKSRKKLKQLTAILLSMGLAVVPPVSNLNLVYAEMMEQTLGSERTEDHGTDEADEAVNGNTADEREATDDAADEEKDEAADVTEKDDESGAADSPVEEGESDAVDGATDEAESDAADGVTDEAESGAADGTAGEDEREAADSSGNKDESKAADSSADKAENDDADSLADSSDAAEEASDDGDLENDLEDTVSVMEFKALHTTAYEFNDKPELETLLGYFPKRLKAIVEEAKMASPSNAEQEKSIEIAVQWECGLDYEHTEASEYTFYPVWDELGYEVADSDSIPEIKVVILNKEAENVVLTATVDDLEVTVTAEVGVLPEGAELRVVKIENEDRVAELTDAIEQHNSEADEQSTLEDALVLDVSIYDQDGNAIQPETSKGTVVVTFHNVEVAKAADADETLEVYHFVEEDVESVQKEEATVVDGTVECSIEHFSEFYIGRKVLKNIGAISTADDLKKAISDAQEGATLELQLAEGTFDLGSDGITINKGLTLTLTGAGTDKTVIKGSAGFDAKKGIIMIGGAKAESLTLNNLKIESTAGNGIAVIGSNPVKLYMNRVDLLVHCRGISYGFEGTGVVEGNILQMSESKILNTRISDYATDTMIEGTQCRGISIFNVADSEVTLTNSEIKGFGYAINVGGTKDEESGVADTHDLAVTLDGCQVYSWTSLNIWGSLATYNVIDTEIIGINTSSGASNSFSAITFNDDIYDQFGNAHAENNTLNITDSTIKNYQSGSCTEDLLRIDCGITELNLSGTVIFEDTTGNINSALDLEYMTNPKEFMESHINLNDATVICKGKDGRKLSFAPGVDVAGGITHVANYRVENGVTFDSIFANGIPIVIEEAGGKNYVHPASSTVQSADWIEIPDTTEVFAGTQNGGDVASGSITMESGIVKYLYGNSKGTGKVRESSIVMNGGTVGVIYGNRGGSSMSGASSLANASDYSVGTMNIEINGGSLQAVSGAFGYSHIDDLNVTVNGGTFTAETSPTQAGILLAGTNGTVENAALTFNDGKTKDIALMQRTLISGNASITVNGGEVGNIYAGSYYDDGDNYAGSGWNGWGWGDINYGQAQNIEITIGADADYDDIYAGFQFDQEGIKEAQRRAAEKNASLPVLSDLERSRVKLDLEKAPKQAATGNNIHSQSLTKEICEFVDYINMPVETPVAYIERGDQHIEFASFEDALLAVRSGDTVHILPGTYAEEMYGEPLPGPLTLKADGAVTLSGGLWMVTEGDLTIDGFTFTKAANVFVTQSGNVTVKNNSFTGAGLIVQNEADAGTKVAITGNRFAEWSSDSDDDQSHAMYLADLTGSAFWTVNGNMMNYTGTAPHSYIKVIGTPGEKADLTKNYWSGSDPIRTRAANGKPFAEVIPSWDDKETYDTKANVYPAYKTETMTDEEVITGVEITQTVAKPVENQVAVSPETVKVPDTAAAEQAAQKAAEAIKEAAGGQELTEEEKAVIAEKVAEKVAEAAAPEKVAEETNKVAEALVSNQAVATAPAEGLSESLKPEKLQEVLHEETKSVAVYVKPVLSNVEMELDVTVDENGEVEVRLVPAKVTFEVSPYLTQYDDNKEVLGEDMKIDNSCIDGKIKFRLPIPAAVSSAYAKIVHISETKGTSTYYAPIQETGGEKYITIEVDHFSRFDVNFVDEIPKTENHSSRGGGGGGSSVSAVNGRWIQDAKGWWYAYNAGGYPSNGWAYLYYGNKFGWYFFDSSGYLMSGWVTAADGKRYYLNPMHDGYFGIMLTGWVQVDGKWYYLNPNAGGPMGALLTSTTTPDGYAVNEKGERIQ